MNQLLCLDHDRLCGSIFLRRTKTNKGTEPTRKCPSVAKHRVTDANYVHTVYFCSFKFPTNTQ